MTFRQVLHSLLLNVQGCAYLDENGVITVIRDSKFFL